MRFKKNNLRQYIGEDTQEGANDKMPTTQPKNQRICAKCGRAFYGNMDSILCPECAKISRSQNVVMQRICTDCGHNFEGGPRARRCPKCRRKAQAVRSVFKQEKSAGSSTGKYVYIVYGHSGMAHPATPVQNTAGIIPEKNHNQN